MVKKGFFEVFSMIMALMVLLSTLSFTLEKHFCGETLIDVALFSKADTCGMKMGNVEMTSVQQKTCCKDKLEVVKGQDKLKKASFEDFKLNHQLFLASLIYSHINLFEGLPDRIIPHKDYSPPNLVADLQVLDQVFII